MTRRHQKDNDADDFLSAVKDVKRLKHNLADTVSAPRVGATRTRPAPNHSEDVAEEVTRFVKGGAQWEVLRQLRSGQIRIEDELDLHGCTVAEAEQELRNFVRRAQVVGRPRAVRVIHGKGIGSPSQKSVLKEKVPVWLRQHDAVLACCVAGATDGGTGALLVLLKRR